MAERKTEYIDGQLIDLPMAADTTIEAGKLVAMSSGYAIPAADTAGLVVMGVAEATVTNAGSAGDVSIIVRRGKAFRLDNDTTNAVRVNEIGAKVYVKDSVTVARSSTNSIVAGECLGLDSLGVWVQTPTYPQPTVDAAPQAAVQAASTATDVDGLKTDFNALLVKLKAAGLMASA